MMCAIADHDIKMKMVSWRNGEVPVCVCHVDGTSVYVRIAAEVTAAGDVHGDMM